MGGVSFGCFESRVDVGGFFGERERERESRLKSERERGREEKVG